MPTNYGGARPGSGRVGKIPEAAYRLQQLTARDKNRDALDESALAISIGCARAALKDLEAEAVRRSSAALELQNRGLINGYPEDPVYAVS